MCFAAVCAVCNFRPSPLPLPSPPFLQITYNPDIEKQDVFCHLLAIPSKDRLESVLKYLLDENEFLAPYGIRSLSRYHCDHPFMMKVEGEEYCVQYVPAESNTYLFGGNSNWRGPIWLCGQCTFDAACCGRIGMMCHALHCDVADGHEVYLCFTEIEC